VIRRYHKVRCPVWKLPLGASEVLALLLLVTNQPRTFFP